MFKLILVDRGNSPLQIVKCLKDHRRIPLNDAIRLVQKENSVLYESDDEQDVRNLEEKVKEFGAITKIIDED